VFSSLWYSYSGNIFRQIPAPFSGPYAGYFFRHSNSGIQLILSFYVAALLSIVPGFVFRQYFPAHSATIFQPFCRTFCSGIQISALHFY
jgi:hypothetical protein